MSKRLIAWLLAAGLLAVLVVWISRHTYWGDVQVPMPLRGEAARDPFYAAQRFAEALGARTQWDTGSIDAGKRSVIVASDWNWGLTDERRRTMEHWVESGGRLVVDRSLMLGDGAFSRWSGVGRVPLRRRRATRRGAAGRRTAFPAARRPARPPPRCRTFVAAGGKQAVPDSTRRYSLCGVDPATTLISFRKPLWALRDGAATAAIRVAIGQGSVTLINATPFVGRGLFDGDHARLFVAATQLRRGDVVHFLSEGEHPSLLALTWQAGRPVVLLSLAAILLALWRSSVRFGPLAPPPDVQRRSLAEQIRGTAQAAKRYGGGVSLQRAAVRALHEAALRRIPGYEQAAHAERIALAADAAGVDADGLRAAADCDGTHGSKRLGSALALLETARRRILRQSKRQEGGTS